VFDNFEESVQLHTLSESKKHKNCNSVIIAALALYFTLKDAGKDKSYEEFELEGILDQSSFEFNIPLRPITDYLYKRNHLVDLNVVSNFITEVKLCQILEDMLNAE